MPITPEQQEQINANNQNLDPDKMVLEDLTAPKDADVTPTQESPEELKAREEGWVPLDEWEGEKDQWVDHKEFLFRGELMGRIKKQTKHINGLKGELDEMRTALKELGEHNKKIAENERKKALQELRAAKKEAFEDQDFEALEEIDEKMSALKSVDLDTPSEPDPKDTDNKEPVVQPEVDKWLSDNTWYSENAMLQGMMNGAAQQLLAEDPDLETEPTVLLNKAKKMVQDTVPHMFESDEDEPAPKPRGVVEPANRNGTTANKGKKVKYSAKMLSDEQKRIGQTFVRSGAIESLDVYAAQLAELGELSQ